MPMSFNPLKNNNHSIKNWRYKVNTACNLQPKVNVSTVANMMRRVSCIWRDRWTHTVACSLVIRCECGSSYLSTFPLQVGASEHLQIVCVKSTLNNEVIQVNEKVRQTNINNVPQESQHCRQTRTDTLNCVSHLHTHKEWWLLSSVSIKWFRLCTLVNF